MQVLANSADVGASGRGVQGAGESEGDLPKRPGEAEGVHQSRGEGKRTARAPEEDQEEHYWGGESRQSGAQVAQREI